MSKANSVKEVLIAAKWILQNVGWCKGSYYKDKLGKSKFCKPSRASTDAQYSYIPTAACLLGSVRLVDCNEDITESSYNFLESLIPLPNVIATFNDNASSLDDVIALLDEAIQKS